MKSRWYEVTRSYVERYQWCTLSVIVYIVTAATDAGSDDLTSDSSEQSFIGVADYTYTIPRQDSILRIGMLDLIAGNSPLDLITIYQDSFIRPKSAPRTSVT